MYRTFGILALVFIFIPSSASSHERSGHLYAQIETQSGREYEGVLRWGNQEAFWDDIFNSSKEEVPWLEEMEDQVESGQSTIKVFGWKLKVGSGLSQGRVFMTRFGDIDRIEIRGDDEGIVWMKGGARFEIEGGSDDVGHKITVHDQQQGEITLHWEKLDTIQFLPTPSGVTSEGRRLYGELSSEAGVFEGFIQWDSQECLSTDLLDGDSEDGELSIEMGDIRSISRASRRGAIVELQDGREMELRGSNDVNDENRGIYVEVEGLGRVRVHWDEFESVEFQPAANSGRGYEDYKPHSTLRGTVQSRDGDSVAGDLVLDLDEEYGWEILNGQRFGVEYYIPLALVQRILPDGRDASRIELISGESLVLERGQDVGEDNAGVVVIPKTDPREPIYIQWDEVEEIVFEAPADARP